MPILRPSSGAVACPRAISGLPQKDREAGRFPARWYGQAVVDSRIWWGMMPLHVLEAGLRETASSSRVKRHLRGERGGNAMENSLFHGVMPSPWSSRWGALSQDASSSVLEVVVGSCIPGSPRAAQGGMQRSSVGCKSTLFASPGLGCCCRAGGSHGSCTSPGAWWGDGGPERRAAVGQA